MPLYILLNFFKTITFYWLRLSFIVKCDLCNVYDWGIGWCGWWFCRLGLVATIKVCCVLVSDSFFFFSFEFWVITRFSKLRICLCLVACLDTKVEVFLRAFGSFSVIESSVFLAKKGSKALSTCIQIGLDAYMVVIVSEVWTTSAELVEFVLRASWTKSSRLFFGIVSM